MAAKKTATTFTRNYPELTIEDLCSELGADPKEAVLKKAEDGLLIVEVRGEIITAEREFDGAKYIWHAESDH